MTFKRLVALSLFLFSTLGAYFVGTLENTSAAPAETPAPIELEAWKPEFSYPPLKEGQADTVTLSTDWFGRRATHWAAHLAHLKGKPDLRYLEVGVYEGRSFLWAFENILTHRSSTATAIDLFPVEDDDSEGYAGPKGKVSLEQRFLDNVAAAGLSDRVTTLKGYSNVVLRGLNEKFDFIYIDASHQAHDVLRDAVLSWDLLKPGGILIFDDYALDRHLPTELRPEMAIDAFVSSFRKEVKILHRGHMAILQRKQSPCHWKCSGFGEYIFHWMDGELYDPVNEAKVPISAGEKRLVQAILRSTEWGEAEASIPAPMQKHPDFEPMLARLTPARLPPLR